MEERGAETGWKCPPHYWIIGSNDVGRCKYCPAVRDFGKVIREEEQKTRDKRSAIAKNTHKTGKPKERKKRG